MANIQGGKNFVANLNRLSRLTKSLPAKAGIVATNFSKERLRKRQWVDRTIERYAPRKRPDRGHLMIRTGRLKRSIRKVKVGREYVIIGTDVPYAQIHNEGGIVKKTVKVRSHIRRRKGRKDATVKSHSRNMKTNIPKRQFMGESALLSRRVENMILKEFKKALK